MYAGKRTQKYNKGDKETVCFYHVAYAFYSESTLCSCVNVKEPLCSKQTQYLTLKWLQRDSNPQPLSQQFSQNSQMVKWLNFAKWLCVLYELQVFMDWNPVVMTTRGGEKRTDWIGNCKCLWIGIPLQ